LFTKEDKILILNSIKQHYNFKNNVEFAMFLDISPQNLSNWYSRGKLDFELLYTKCLGISGDWLLSGKGKMFLNEEPQIFESEESSTCQACKGKDQMIGLQSTTIDALKEAVSQLKRQIHYLESDQSGQGSASGAQKRKAG
jgi:hypothetical protein